MGATEMIYRDGCRATIAPGAKRNRRDPPRSTPLQSHRCRDTISNTHSRGLLLIRGRTVVYTANLVINQQEYRTLYRRRRLDVRRVHTRFYRRQRFANRNHVGKSRMFRYRDRYVREVNTTEISIPICCIISFVWSKNKECKIYTVGRTFSHNCIISSYEKKDFEENFHCSTCHFLFFNLKKKMQPRPSHRDPFVISSGM